MNQNQINTLHQINQLMVEDGSVRMDFIKKLYGTIYFATIYS
jgi:hypothetical protein